MTVLALPDLTGFESALDTLADTADRLDDRLADAPTRSERTDPVQADIDVLLEETRRLRSAFMDRYASHVYDELTSRGHTRPRLSALVERAAEEFPGLVPSADRMAAEARLGQREKDGLEIDQAIFVHGVLNGQWSGQHLLDSMRLPTDRALGLLAEFRAKGRVDLGRVVLERRSSAAHLTMTDPGSLNAETDELVAAMETAVDLTLLDPDVRVGVLRGGEVTHPRYAGRRVFSAGINLVHLHQGRISYLDFLVGREIGLLNKLSRGLHVLPDAGEWAVRNLQKPWIGAVDTFAIGGGMQLLFVMDRVIAGSDAYFSLPAAREGIVPGAGNLRLPRLVGNRLARQVILSGRRIRADEQAAALVCDTVVEPDLVDDAVNTAVEELSAPAVVANRAMLAMAEEPPDAFRAYMAEFALQQGQRLYASDVLEKISKFTVSRSAPERR